MSDFNIPIIEPTVDYTKVRYFLQVLVKIRPVKIPPINQKRTIAFINHFIAHTITFLNKFSLSCEEKLFEFENKLQRVEASLEILEARLSSIPIENESNVKKNEDESNSKNEEVQKVEEQVEATQEIDQPDNNEVPTEPKVNETEMQPISADPRYAKYFKLVHIGAAKAAVQLKMEQEGLDPSVLDNPNQLVPKVKSSDDADANTNS